VKRGNSSETYIQPIIIFQYRSFAQLLSDESQGLESNSFSMKSDQDFQIEVRVDGHCLNALYRQLEATSFLVRPNVEQHLSRTQLPLFAEKYKERERSSRFE
jgi:hypothetical protein